MNVYYIEILHPTVAQTMFEGGIEEQPYDWFVCWSVVETSVQMQWNLVCIISSKCRCAFRHNYTFIMGIFHHFSDRSSYDMKTRVIDVLCALIPQLPSHRSGMPGDHHICSADCVHLAGSTGRNMGDWKCQLVWVSKTLLAGLYHCKWMTLDGLYNSRI